MVKNTKGGSGHKGQARKFASSSTKQSSKLRISLDEYEIYAQVTGLLGNGMCHVLCQDDKTRLCMIRGKFRGRGKRDNTICRGTWILVGLREWASEGDGKMEKCDLLEVYSDSDKSRLRSQVVDVNWLKFVANDALNSFTPEDKTGIEFSDERTDDYKKLMEQELGMGKKDSIQLEILEEGMEKDMEIDIDDI